MKRNPALIRFALFTLAITIGFYFLFDRFLKVVSTEIVSAWYNGEFVNIQEGQILPSISKNRNLIEKSPLIKGVFVIDLNDIQRPLLNLGKQPTLPPIDQLKFSDGVPIHTLRTRFLEQLVVVTIPNNNLVLIYYIASDFLLLGYLLCVAISIASLLYIVSYTKRIADETHARKERIYTEIRERLAHDLKSPMLSLSALGLKAKSIDANLFQQLNSIVSRFQNILSSTNEIHKDLVKNDLDVAIDTKTILSPLFPLIFETIIEKRPDFASNSEFEIKVNADENAKTSFAEINPIEFKRHLSNLLQNSFEAIANKGKVSIDCSIEFSKLRIRISDTGKGIAPEHLASIGVRNFTQGKPNGNGLGFHYAKLAFQLWNGSISIQSKVNVGTDVEILIPIQNTPAWYVSTLNIPNDHLVVCVDDDITIINQIREKLGGSSEKINLVHFQTSKEFSAWFNTESEKYEKILFLFDFHLGKTVTGLDLITKYGLESESILMTTAYLEAEVTSQARLKHISVFPKSLISFVQ